MDKYIQLLQGFSFDLLHIAQSFATDNKSPKIEPAHLLRALLHKSAGLVNFIEDTLDEDYYYLVDWTDMRIKQCDKSPYGMKGPELSHEAQMVVKEALEISLVKNPIRNLNMNRQCVQWVWECSGYEYNPMKFELK